MRKTHANWNKQITLTCDCPYCDWQNDIEDKFEVEDYMEEFDESSLEGIEIKCFHCGKIFGLNEVLE